VGVKRAICRDASESVNGVESRDAATDRITDRSMIKEYTCIR
jgi:hypothetical protein